MAYKADKHTCMVKLNSTDSHRYNLFIIWWSTAKMFLAMYVDRLHQHRSTTCTYDRDRQCGVLYVQVSGLATDASNRIWRREARR